jgi:hypothetical protein
VVSNYKMTKRMRTNIKFLKKLKDAKSLTKCREVLLEGGRAELTTVAEMIKNLLANKIPLDKRFKRRLCQYKRELRRLASRQTNYKQKRSISQTGGVASVASKIVKEFWPFIIQNMDMPGLGI